MKTETAAPTARFDWTDPLLLDAQLTEEERMVRDTARAYAQARLAPRALEMFRTEKVDATIFREMGDLDLLGIVIPEQYGGAGMGYVEYSIILDELAQADPSVALTVAAHNSLHANLQLTHRIGPAAGVQRPVPVRLRLQRHAGG